VTVDQQLDKLADDLEPKEFQEGDAIIGPDEGQEINAFQGDVLRLRRYASEGWLEIRREHIEDMSGNRFVDRVHIRMGPEGVRWRKELRSEEAGH
jgi:hypothetical protein